MSTNKNGGANSPSGMVGKPAGTDGAKAPEHPVGEALERLQSIYGSDGEADSSSTRRKAKPPAGNLIAYSGVKVKGKIASCDTLTVEGDINGTVRARQIIVADAGTFVGRADVGDAEIAGHFDGTLRVLGKLTIRRTGRLSGNITYGQIEIEAGGELRGRVDVRPMAKRNGFFSASSTEKSWSWSS
jgi:cytoskeletal protein CcmA (bactofilin family)